MTHQQNNRIQTFRRLSIPSYPLIRSCSRKGNFGRRTSQFRLSKTLFTIVFLSTRPLYTLGRLMTKCCIICLIVWVLLLCHTTRKGVTRTFEVILSASVYKLTSKIVELSWFVGNGCNIRQICAFRILQSITDIFYSR